MSLSRSDLDRLEALARAERKAKKADETSDEPGQCVELWVLRERAALIAACDVETILSLISEIRGWRTAAGIERTAGYAHCIIDPEVP